MLPTDPARLMLLGDMHGNHKWAETVFRRLAPRRGAQVVVPLGDFGYWDHARSGVTYLNQIDEDCERHGLTCVFVDGNHENHTLLRSLPVGTDGFVQVRPNIFWAPRGHRWTWSGVTFGALGGAISSDRHDRKPGLDWWAEEELTASDVEALGHAPLDVLLCHDTPAGAPVGTRQFPDLALEQAASQTRELLADAVRNTTPQIVFHGHWHQRLSGAIPVRKGDELTWVRVEGLHGDPWARGGDSRSWILLDLPALTTTSQGDIDRARSRARALPGSRTR